MSEDRSNATWAEIEAEVRNTWGRLTPYRCGLVAGAWGATVSPPPGKSNRWYLLFLKGRRWLTEPPPGGGE